MKVKSFIFIEIRIFYLEQARDETNYGGIVNFRMNHPKDRDR